MKSLMLNWMEEKVGYKSGIFSRVKCGEVMAHKIFCIYIHGHYDEIVELIRKYLI